MEPGSPEQKETKKSNETVLPPEIIRPLGRALQQRFSPDLEIIQKGMTYLQTSDLPPDYKKRMQSALDELNRRIRKMQTAKEVKLVGEGRPTTWGLECSEEDEREESMVPLPPIIKVSKPLLKKLGPALQDYMVGSANEVRKTLASPLTLGNDSPDIRKALDQIDTASHMITDFLKWIRLSPTATITTIDNESRIILPPLPKNL